MLHLRFFLTSASLSLLLTSCAGLTPLTHSEINERTTEDTVTVLPSGNTPDKIDSDDLEQIEAEQESSSFTEALLSPVKKIAELTSASEVEDEELTNLDQELDKSVETQALDLDLSYKQEHYDFWLKYFTNKDRARFIRHLKNGEEFREVIRAILKEEGLPADLFYVGLIESGYNLKIKSHASATGPWQFMKGTGKQYGLRVDHAVDERYNIYKSTIAAAKYFRDLYNIFGSWELALCAYNAGEFRIIRAIRKGGTRDYRELVAKKLIPKETVYYIPKVAAARELSKKREHYNINVTKKDGLFYKNTVLRKVRGRFNVNKLASDLGLDVAEFKKLNPDLRHQTIQTSASGHRIVLPSRLTAKFDREKDLHQRHAPVVRSATKVAYHKVRRGENLSLISKRYGVSIGELKRNNQLKGDLLFVGQKIKLAKSSVAPRSVASAPKAKNDFVIYKVKRGDNLTTIARQFATSYHAIKRLNSMRSNRVFVGQRLKVPTKYQLRVYTVKRGDTLIQIAKRFSTSLDRLMAFNSLKSGQIYPNQKLKIPTNG